MIKDNKSKVKITTRNIKYYSDRGHCCKVGDIISISIDTMPIMSHNIVIAICELCQSENEIPFSKYNRNKDRQGFYSCKKCSGTKRKKTMLLTYGVEYGTQLEKTKELNRIWMSSNEFRLKSVKTQIENYGCLYVQTGKNIEFISELHKERIKGLKENGEYFSFLSSPENLKLRGDGMFKKYGATSSFNVPSIKRKIQERNLEKFGHISPFGNIETQEKSKSTLLEKYGVDNPFKSFEIKKRIKKRINEKYGVDNPMQDENIFKKQQKSSFRINRYKDTDLHYQGTYELDFLEYCEINNIEVKNGPSIIYKIDNIEKVYHSDFYLPAYNLICEIKSTYTFENKKYVNILKREYSVKNGYEFIFIVDKNYSSINGIINKMT